MIRIIRGGFTLIELLIVVAIIAILAAIAVPNFLEAQVRAKASRAKSDLRTAITAIESYMVDNNKYPAPVDIAATPNNLALPNVHSASLFLPGGIHTLNGTGEWGGLTSPIAYMTSIPQDNFATKYAPTNDRIAYQNVQLYEQALYGGDGVVIALGENGTTSLGKASPENVPYTALYGSYIVRSLGPDQGYSSVDKPYDPTNGTVSWGDIYRTAQRQKNTRSVGGE
jgi:prepilin-type N-terminal cleavage/methylation domain-containing protein